MEPKFQVQLKIRKPASEVFEAVVNPDKLTGYFIQKSSGPLEPGKTVEWKFAEVEEPFDVVVHEVVKDQRIVFEWPTYEDYLTRVEMEFKPLDAGNTMVSIRETGWRDTPKGIETSYGNCGGWMHMMACMKAYLEYGINLRTGGAC